jgi:ligand-binding SRPBCC domain-containing protein
LNQGVYPDGMTIYSLKRVQNIPTTLDKAWDFFSSPLNLAQITPQELKFDILYRPEGSASHGQSLDTSRHAADRAYAGQLIEYRLSPLPGVRVYWMTEITHVVEGRYFVDEQRRGPYKMWHHQHHFRQIEGGVEMTDIVHYQLPLGVLGKLAHGVLVRRQLEHIFAYRQERIVAIFGSWASPTMGACH